MMIGYMQHSAAPTEEGRFSFGTTPVVDKLLDVVNNGRNKNGYMFMINLSTLIRNRWRKELKISTVVNLVRKDMTGIATELSEACKLKDGFNQHSILFYTMTYGRMIPEEYQRSQNSEQRIKCNDALIALIKQVPSTVRVDGNFAVEVAHYALKEPSYKVLVKYYKAKGGKHEVYMMSHQALDYHMFGSGVTGNIVKSYIAEVIPGKVSTLGEVVFKQPTLPFYPCTHVLFGDKELVKGSLGRKEKNEMLEWSKLGGWNLRTRTYVMEKLKNHNIQLPYTLE